MLTKTPKTLFYSFCKYSGLSSLGIALQRRNIQILTYHGVCEKSQAKDSYIPSYFVYAQEFRRQMRYLSRKMNPISLKNALEMIKGQTVLVPKSVVVTFDDGYLNNLEAALPIIKEFKVPVTIFLSTQYLSSGELFPFDKQKLLFFWLNKNMISKYDNSSRLSKIPAYYTNPYKIYADSLAAYWEKYKHLLTDPQYQLLRPMSWDDAKKVDNNLVNFGAHTNNHVILANEKDCVCRDEISSSVDLIKEELSSNGVAFSYPVGTNNCFNENTKKLVKNAGCFCGLTTITGSNSSKQDIFSLLRRPVSLNHNLSVFIAELAGLRDIILKAKSSFTRISNFIVRKINRYLTIAKRFGLRACLKMLGLSLIRKLFIFVREDIFELDHQPNSNGNQHKDLTFKFAQAEDVINSRIFREFGLSREDVLNRFASGKRCFTAWRGSDIVNLRWVDRERFLLPGCFDLKLPKNCAYVDKGYTASKSRGQGISPTSFFRLYSALKAESVDSIFLYVEFENLPSIKEKNKVGFRKIGFYRKIGFRNRTVSWLKVQDSQLKNILIAQGVIGRK